MKRSTLTYLALILSIAVICPGLLLAEKTLTPITNLPTGEKIIAGDVTIDRSITNAINVNIASQNAIVEWVNFSVAAGYALNFNFNISQPSSGSILNNVVGSGISVINGAINSNGTVFLVNPNGIAFGSSAQVNCSSLIASTLKMDYDNFLNPAGGRYKFYKDAATNGFIINAGRIAAQPGGYVALLSQAVNNSGTIAVSSIDAKVGRIVLASGERMTVSLDDKSQISVAIEEGVKEKIFGPDGNQIDSAIKNSGTIIADGGRVTLTAKTLNRVFDYAINNTGIIQAASLVNNDGIIELIAEGAPISSTGRIEAGKVIINAVDTDLFNFGSIISQNAAELPVKGDIYINAVNILQDGRILSSGVIAINVDDMRTTQVVVLDPNGLAQDSNGASTLPDAIIQGNQVRITFKKLGSSDRPIQIKAPQTYIYRKTGDINILDSLGIGTSIWMRGPPEDNFSIVYSKDTNLTLEAGQVNLIGSAPLNLYGNIVFYNLICTVSDKEIYFEAGKTYAFNGALSIIGSPDIGPEEYYIKLRSQESGKFWYLNIQNAGYVLERVSLSDAYALENVIIPIGADSGNNVNFEIDPVWDGGGSNNNWSTANNWDGNVVPTVSQEVRFNGTSTENCTINNVGSWSGGKFVIESGYTGTITQNVNITTGDFEQAGGTFNVNGKILNIKGSFSHTGGTFTTSGTVKFIATTTGETITSGGTVFNKLTFNGASGEWTLQDDLSTNGVLTLTDGTLITNDKVLNINSYSHTGGTFTAGASSITCNGKYSVTGGTYNADNSTLTLDATSGGFTFTADGYTFNNVIFKNSSNGNARTITLGSGIFTFLGYFYLQANGTKNLTVDAAVKDPDVNITGNLDFTGTGTGSEIIKAGNETWSLEGNVDFTGGTFTPNAGTVNYNAAGAQTVAGVTYNNLTLSGSGVKTTTGVTVNGILSMEGTATASTAPTYGASATLQYKGSATQTTGPELTAVIPNLTVNNINGVILSSSPTITGTLTLTSGKFLVTVTANAGQSKVYGNVDPILACTISSGNLVSGDTFSGALGRAAGETVAGGPYAITQGTLDAGTNYAIIFVPDNFAITAKVLTVTGITANNKTYDGNTTAVLNTGSAALSGVIAGDAVTLDTSSAIGTFDSPDAGTGVTVTVSGLTIGGGDAPNYSLTQPTTTADITPQPAPPSNPTTTATITTQLSAFEVPRYLSPDLIELIVFQINTFSPGAGGGYYYHPLTPYDMAAFDAMILNADSYTFLNGTLSLIGHDGLLSMFEELRNRGAAQ